MIKYFMQDQLSSGTTPPQHRTTLQHSKQKCQNKILNFVSIKEKVLQYRDEECCFGSLIFSVIDIIAFLPYSALTIFSFIKCQYLEELKYVVSIFIYLLALLDNRNFQIFCFGVKVVKRKPGKGSGSFLL